MALIARRYCYAILAAALVLTPAAANAQGDLIQGLSKGLKKQKSTAAAPRKAAPTPSKTAGPTPSGKAAATAPKKPPVYDSLLGVVGVPALPAILCRHGSLAPGYPVAE